MTSVPRLRKNNVKTGEKDRNLTRLCLVRNSFRRDLDAGIVCRNALRTGWNPDSADRKLAIFGFTNPVFGVLLSAWCLGEGSAELGWNALIALVLVCIGICIVNVKINTGNKTA
mgnify:CR=1 FL=1